MILRDGVPISRAAGNTEFQEVDPLTIRYIEVFKGANGLRYGSTQLGGAVNVVNRLSGFQLRSLESRLFPGQVIFAHFSIYSAGMSFDAVADRSSGSCSLGGAQCSYEHRRPYE
ncbi:TonB-dependent receptor plug domain-containing protein [Erythrobacter sp. KY5]|uniref:TonB-dependent receptor plug domain-containing protein n=1 Tax=Erythrobacter sp. KY5 TaxID=2011159 RepID=UPI0018F8902B|nr:Plug domain-containing protein [Erythrobacter sp. KY5]